MKWWHFSLHAVFRGQNKLDRVAALSVLYLGAMQIARPYFQLLALWLQDTSGMYDHPLEGLTVVMVAHTVESGSETTVELLLIHPTIF